MKKLIKELKLGDNYNELFSYTQNEVDIFAKISGDLNPLHIDEEFAKNSIFGQRIIHGYLGTSIFSKVFAMNFPGEGSIYLKQDLKFFKPMFTVEKYRANFVIIEHLKDKHRALFQTNIYDSKNNLIVKGEAIIQNSKLL